MAAETDRAAASGRVSPLNDPRVRAVFYQMVVVAVLAVVGWYLVSNTLENLSRQRIATGFGFLDREAGFEISESLIPYSAASNYARALLVGLLNTFKVAAIGIVLATVLGTTIGILRLSSNWLVARIATVYVETLRNVPVLLQLFVWYGIVTESLPLPRAALNPVPGLFLSARGIVVPAPLADAAYGAAGVALILGIVGAWIVGRWARRRQAATGRQFPSLWVGLALIIGLPVAAWLAWGAPLALELPELRGFNFQGGLVLSPEFAALLFGLSFYTAAFIAEVVRGGIQAVSYGQTEAAAALGLRPGLALRLVVLPQAMRIIIPPTTSQYLNLTKNSSLAVAIGYPDLVSVGNTTSNQTGQAIEAITIFMAVYLLISLTISFFMNWYNARIALVGR